MLKRFLAAIGLAVMLAAPAAALDLDVLNKRVDQNLVGVGTGCSGTLINPDQGVVITAYHCIANAIRQLEEPEKDEDGIILRDEDDKPKTTKEKKVEDIPVWQKFPREGDDETFDSLVYRAEIIARDQATDVAILKLRTKVGPYTLPLPEAEPVILVPKDYNFQRGATVWAVGNPRGLYGTVTKGSISAFRDVKREFGITPSPVIQYDGGIYFGSSGGALYDDEGRYLGIGFALMNGMAGEPMTFVGFFTPTEHIWKVAEENCVADLIYGDNPEKCQDK